MLEREIKTRVLRRDKKLMLNREMKTRMLKREIKKDAETGDKNDTGTKDQNEDAEARDKVEGDTGCFSFSPNTPHPSLITDAAARDTRPR